MLEIIAVFPGQGSQYVGMGSKCEDQSLFDQANVALAIDLKNLCFTGPDEELKLTQNTQPAILTHSMTLWNELKDFCDQKNIKIKQVLGHSVGEYAALVAAESLNFEDAIKGVKLRGQSMQAAVPVGQGSMIAVLRAPAQIVADACQKACELTGKTVQAANFNDPAQTVISGDKLACDKASEILKENPELPRVRTVELPVSAPFHSQLMKPAEIAMAQYFTEIDIKPNKIPYIANIDANEYPQGTEKTIIAQNLTKQVCGSVQWLQSIEQLNDEQLFIEVGPGNVLAGLIKRIKPNATTISMDKVDWRSELESLLK